MNNDQLIEELKSKLKTIIAESYKDNKSEFEKDLKAFLEISNEKLERWMILFSTGDLTEEELEWLLKSQLDLMTLQGLQTTGISKIKLNALKNNIIKMIFKVIIDMIIPGA
jgi:stress response protein SCP2